MRLLLVVSLALGGCGGPSTSTLGARQDRGASIVAQMEQHDSYVSTERAIDDALNRPTGPDYPAAIGIVERSTRAPLQKDLDIGDLLLSACRDGVPLCTGPQTAQQGLARLVRVATTQGEDREIAAGHLSRWYTNGARSALLPDPRQAACWAAVRSGTSVAARCVTSAP